MGEASKKAVIRHGPYPELTWPAVLVGYVLGCVIAISIGYAALILGFSIEGSELAAILGWGILRGAMRRTSIIENNINQTLASSVNGASAGMMFSVPALFILSSQYPGTTQFSPSLMVLTCITGGLLGLCFIIPLRKQMIDFNRLAYPGGIAVATILKSPGAGMRKCVILLCGAAFSGLVHVAIINLESVAGFLGASLDSGLLSFIHGGGSHRHVAVGEMFSLPEYLNLNVFISVMTVGVGFLSGRGGLWFGAGGFLCYFFLAPVVSSFGSEGVQGLVEQGPGALRGSLFRPAGIGLLIGAAVGSICFAAPMIRSAIRSMQESSKTKQASGAQDTRASAEMPVSLLYFGVSFGALALVALAYFSVPEMTLGRAVGVAVLGILWVWVAGVIVSECLGRTNWSPLSGMTLIAVTILILITSGIGDTPQIVASVMVGAAICVAISQAGDMMLDLKSGYLVGASPKKQQIAQFLGTWLGPIVVMSLIFVLHKSHGLGSDALPAPQGQALASMIEGIVGGDVPTHRYAAAAILGLTLALSGLGGIGVLIGLGFYMPFDIVLAYTIGNFLRIACDRFGGRTFVGDVGIPAAAGFIVGEALVGVGAAMVAVFG